MRILVLCKRQYTGKDLLDDRYGRTYELPAALASRGHDVYGLTWSYQRRGRSRITESGVKWWSEDALPLPFHHWMRLKRILSDHRPEVIWASSDALHAVLAARVGRIFRLPIVIDLYDDYEAFGMTSALGLAIPLRKACAAAASLTVVGSTLEDTMRRRVPRVDIAIIGNGISQEFLSPPTREQARRRLGLPLGTPLVGTAGALDASRDIDVLLLAFRKLRLRQPDVRLVVAGPRDRATAESFDEDIIDLGELPPAQVSWLFSALDVGVVCNRDSQFGRACNPQKLSEMVACKLPVVAASVGEVARRLKGFPASLYPAGNSSELAIRLEAQLNNPLPVPLSIVSTWHERSEILERILQNAIDQFN